MLKDGNSWRRSLKTLWEATFSITCAKLRVPDTVCRKEVAENIFEELSPSSKGIVSYPPCPSSEKTFNENLEARELYSNEYQNYVEDVATTEWCKKYDYDDKNPESNCFLGMHPRFSSSTPKEPRMLLRELAICYGYDDWYRDFTKNGNGQGSYEGSREDKFAIVWCNFKHFFKKDEETGQFLMEKRDYNKPLDRDQIDLVEFLRDDLVNYMTEEQKEWATKLVLQRCKIIMANEECWDSRKNRSPCCYSHKAPWENKSRYSPEYQKLVSLFDDYDHPFLHYPMPSY
jgi:hypothetical protein